VVFLKVIHDTNKGKQTTQTTPLYTKGGDNSESNSEATIAAFKKVLWAVILVTGFVPKS
jgi:hypothetical protein